MDDRTGVLRIVCFVLLSYRGASGQQQAFREAPANVSVIQGQTAVLKCRVDNRKGDLQWTTDGFALGFDRSIPGFPRYRMDGSEALGESDLLILNSDLEDDGEFQCQVGPNAGDPSLLGVAQLSVLIPPERPQIENYSNGSLVKVPHEQKELNLTCTSANGKPAATLTWLRNGEEVSAETPVKYSSTELSNKLENAKSVLTITPEEEDNEAFFTCQANNPALQRPLDTIIQLSVMHPPGQPEIEGYSRDQIVRTGDTMKLKCVSRGGNPLAQVYWYRNDNEIDFSYTSGNGRAENELVFTVQPTDNKARYRCEATNLVTPVSLTAEVVLKVHFAPAKVKIVGHKNAKAGDTIHLTCSSSISNPPAKITWISRGQQLRQDSEEVAPSPEGGFITKSKISVTLTDRDDDVIYQCTATHDELGKVVTDTVTLMVMYPPDPPTIAGYIEGRQVYKGSVQTLTCTCVGGNPLATLTWLKDGIAVSQESVIRQTGNIVTSQLSFLLDADDNQAQYTCNATNSATADALLTSVTLTVNFPPESLNISIRPRKVRVGQPVSVTCTSASSNPPSDLSWLREGDEVAGIEVGVHSAENGGTSTVSRLEIVPRIEDDGQIYACMATNKLLEQAVSDAVTLDVLYKPFFSADVPTTLDVPETSFGMINVTATANPPKIKYTWFRLNEKVKFGKLVRPKRDLAMTHFLQDGALLNATNVTRGDAGNYFVQASNSEGETNFTVLVNVQYAPLITKAPKKLYVDADTVASVYCEVDANPLDVTMVEWSRTGYNMSNTTPELSGQTAMLKIASASKEDSGIFTCKVNNGIGNPVEDTAVLLVKHSPEIDPSPAYSKAAAEKFASAALWCKAQGVPDINFKWYRGTAEVDTSEGKFETTFKQTGIVSFESSLIVHNTTKSDYDRYKCVALNEVGMDERLIQLDGTSRPDPPFEMRFVNATHNSVTLTWKGGFDGGSSQRFQVRYKEMPLAEGKGTDGKVETYKYEDVFPSSSTLFTIKELKLATSYEMTVRGINRLGEGAFQPNVLIARTSAVAPLSDSSTPDDVPLIIILTVSILGMVLLGLNVLLILFFIRRRRKNKDKDLSSESASQANSVEMFNAPPSVDDSKSYSTYDPKSIDGFRDSPYHDTDDERRFFPNDSYDKDPYASPPYVSGYPPPTHPSGHYGPMDNSRHDPRRYPRDDMPRGVSLGPGENMEEEELYANQLRKMQQSITGPPEPRSPNGSMGYLGPDYGGRNPPPPPNRSSSRTALDGDMNNPPIPQRHYDMVDAPRYNPAPGSAYRYPPTDQRGALV